MDANKIQQESKEFAEKLASAEQIDFDYAINQYFEDNAQYVNDAISVRGVSKIKKVFTLASNVKAEGKLVGQPRYNSHKQTLTFKTSSTYVSPTLPSIVPFHSQLSGFKATTEWEGIAHLSPNNDEQGDGGAKGQKLFITKLEVVARNPTTVQRVLPLGLLRPLTSLAVLFFASALTFAQQHKSDNPIQFVLAAVASVWSALWETLIAESSKRQAQAEQWKDNAGPQLRQLYDQALSTASKVQADLEARGKAAGIPVDDYKQRASQAIAELSENVEARAKAANMSVDEYKKQAETIIEDLKKRALAAGQQIQERGQELAQQAQKKGGEAAQQAKETGGNVAQQAKETGGDVAQQAKETGGNVAQQAKETGENVAKQTKQTAKDAKKKGDDYTNGKNSQQASKPTQDSNANGNTNGNTNGNGLVIGSDQPEKSHEEIQAEFEKVPHTPLGGHDPTAKNAPSFALAAQL